MVYINKLALAAAIAASAFELGAAHPGDDVKAEAAKRAAQMAARPHAKRSLAHCAEKFKERGIEQRAVERRNAWHKEILKKRHVERSGKALSARDAEAVLNTTHLSNLTGLTADSDYTELFASYASCVLQAETTEGPYYVEGEYIRSDVTEDQDGVPLYADVQIVDVTTCDPIDGAYVDWWSTNATAIYSGVTADGGSDNINGTAMRGVQPTNEDGVIQMTSLYPAYYQGRTTHVHILVHDPTAVTVNDNGTISGDTAMHVGQLYFDQNLTTQVSAISPYDENTATLVTNAEDMFFLQEAATSDPVMQYVLLGDTVADGLLAWISVGVDTTESYEVSVAAILTEDGGVSESSGSGFPPTS